MMTLHCTKINSPRFEILSEFSNIKFIYLEALTNARIIIILSFAPCITDAIAHACLGTALQLDSNKLNFREYGYPVMYVETIDV